MICLGLELNGACESHYIRSALIGLIRRAIEVYKPSQWIFKSVHLGWSVALWTKSYGRKNRLS